MCFGMIIREYNSNLWDHQERNGRPYISVASDKLKSLLIHTDNS